MESIEEYFRRITRFEPTEQQIELLHSLNDDSIEKLVVLGGRGFSKSLCCSIFVLYRAELSLENGKSIKEMLASPQDSIFKYVNQYFANSSKLMENLVKGGIYTTLPITGFELRNGTECFLKKATNKVRSSRADILIMDEAADISAEIIKSANACLTGAEPNRIILVSTPHKSGYFNEIAENSEDWTVKQYSSLLAPWMKKTIDRARTMHYSPEEFAIEYEGRLPTKAEKSFFGTKNVDDAVQDVALQREGGAKSIVECGVDFGYDSPTVVTLSEKIGASARKILDLKQWKNFPIEISALEIAKVINIWSTSLTKADSRPSEYQNKIEPYTRCDITYMNMQIHKKLAYGQFQRKLREKQIIIPKSLPYREELVRQLKAYVWEEGKLGKRGDDLVDATVLSCYDEFQDIGKLDWGKQTGGCVAGPWNTKQRRIHR